MDGVGLASRIDEVLAELGLTSTEYKATSWLFPVVREIATSVPDRWPRRWPTSAS